MHFIADNSKEFVVIMNSKERLDQYAQKKKDEGVAGMHISWDLDSIQKMKDAGKTQEEILHSMCDELESVDKAIEEGRIEPWTDPAFDENGDPVKLTGPCCSTCTCFPQ